MRHPILVVVGAVVLAGLAAVHTQSAAPTDLFFSEYLEGNSNNKALEIYNGTGAPVDLAAAGYSVQMFFNGSATAGLTINLTGTVSDGDVYVLAHQGAAPDILAQADQTNSSGWFNGDDAVVLRRGSEVVDVIGQVGIDPGTEWGTGNTSTADNTLTRLAGFCTGDVEGSDAFDPQVQWEGFFTNTIANLGVHSVTCGATTDEAPAVSAVTPVNGSAAVPLNSDVLVTFSEPVQVTPSAFTLACTLSGSHAAVVSGGPTTFTLNPGADFVFDERCTLTVAASEVADQDTSDPPDAMAADVTASFTTDADPCRAPFTPIYSIQGAGASAAITGPLTTQGVVVGDYEGAGTNFIRGFFIQDPAGDGDPATSDGIFVFNGANDAVRIGDLVRVTGTAGEFQGQTQIGSVTAIRGCGTSATVSATVVTLPFAAPVAGVDDAERFEGMLVRLPQTLVVTELFQLGRFGQVVLSAGGRLAQPTHVAAPGAAAAEIQAANDLNRVVVDDGQNDQNPDPIVFGRAGQPLSAANTLRAGDTASGIVGVMTYSWAGHAAGPNAWRVRPVNALGGAVVFDAANPRPEGAPAVGGTLKVVGMNLLNYFNTFDGAGSSPPFACRLGEGGELTDCRGADDAGEFDRQWPKTVAAILGSRADVVGVAEIENDGYGPGSAIADLVAKLNAAAGSGTYRYVDADAEAGRVNALGTDAIKVGLIFKPAAVMPIGLTAVLDTRSFVTGGDAVERNRPALAQAFQTPAGGRVVVVVNHLKSKGSACDAPDPGDGQGNCHVVRTNAAAELAAWMATDPTSAGDVGALVIGDLNSYAQEDPIKALQDAGFVNLLEQLSGPRAYSYGFDGQWGYLDHALASPALGPQVTGVAEYHINADEPSVLDYNDDFKSASQMASLYGADAFRAGDHDPVIVGLGLEPNLSGEVSAAGWYTSRTGAMPGRAQAAGTAIFALTARYRKGALAPAGVFKVLFLGGRMDFTARSASWLTAGASRAVLQGEGTINGAGRYAFRVTLVEGEGGGAADRIRIRIWAESGAVVYDTGLQTLGGGRILVP